MRRWSGGGAAMGERANRRGVVVAGRGGQRFWRNWLRRLLPLVALVYFHILFTFENVVATPFVRWSVVASLEVAIVFGIIALAVRLGLRPGIWFKLCFGLIVFAFWLLRYVDRTALGVLGREFNLHGDFPHLHRVGAMFYESMSPLTAGIAILVLLLFVLIPVVLNVAFFSVLARRFEAGPWAWLVCLMAVAAVFYHIERPDKVSASTSSILKKQVGHVLSDEARLAQEEAERWPSYDSLSLSKLGDADVILIFLESYGVTLIDDPQHFDGIQNRMERFESGLRASGFSVRSHRIHSPTFGGGSWRAHASFISGVDVKSEHHYNALMASPRRTLVHAFADAGYRTVAIEPGIQWYWPDGEFYGFDEIYDAQRIAYTGPPMGWWKIPDQYTLFRLVDSELMTESRQPVFAKLSLIMTHIPYFPIPPYVQDWTLLKKGNAYESGLKSIAHDDYRDLTELSGRYVTAFEYEFDVLEGFLTNYVSENALVIVLGDHQPPKLATHDNDSWATPIHVFSKRPELVDAFAEWGFEPSVFPTGDTGLRMNEFLARFIETFGD